MARSSAGASSRQSRRNRARQRAESGPRQKETSSEWARRDPIPPRYRRRDVGTVKPHRRKWRRPGAATTRMQIGSPVPSDQDGVAALAPTTDGSANPAARRSVGIDIRRSITKSVLFGTQHGLWTLPSAAALDDRRPLPACP